MGKTPSRRAAAERPEAGTGGRLRRGEGPKASRMGIFGLLLYAQCEHISVLKEPAKAGSSYPHFEQILYNTFPGFMPAPRTQRDGNGIEVSCKAGKLGARFRSCEGGDNAIRSSFCRTQHRAGL